MSKRHHHIVIALVGIWLAIILIPYHLPDVDLLQDTSGTSFTESFGPSLLALFEEAPHQFSKRLELSDIQISVDRNRAVASLTQPDGHRMDIIIDTSASGGERISYANVQIPDSISGKLRQDLLAALDAIPNTVSSDSIFVDSQQSSIKYGDFYAHVIMLFLALSFLLVFWQLPTAVGGISREMTFILLLGVVAIFFFTTATPADIKLHFFNEARQAYLWDIYGPGNPAFQKMIYRLLGIGDSTLFAANRVFAIFTALPLFVIARERFGGRMAGLAAALLLVCHPLWLRYGASDTVHPWAMFLFFSGVALLLEPVRVTPIRLLSALLAIAMAMLARGELMLLPIATLLLIGPRRLIEIARALPRSSLYGVIAASTLILPQVLALSVLGFQEEGLFKQETHIIWQSWLLLRNANSYTNPAWSPWIYVILTVIGFAVLVRRRPASLPAALLCPLLFLWNSFVLNRSFTGTHYQIVTIPFYILSASAALGVFGDLLVRKLRGIAKPASHIAIVITLIYVSILPYRELLSGNFTYMAQYRTLRDVRHMMPNNCVLIYYHPIVDRDLHNPEQVWFDREPPLAQSINLETAPAAPEADCAVYLRTPACNTFAYEPPHDVWRTRCTELESRMRWKPIWETTIPENGAFGERYYVSDIPVGLYRLTGFDNHSYN